MLIDNNKEESMKQLKAIFLSACIATLLFAVNCNAEKIHGIVKTDNNYSYVYFGDYDNYNYYDQLKKFLGNDTPANLQNDDNQVGLHMTIKKENLKNGYKISDLQGNEYDFNTENSFTEFDTGHKDWYVKKLTPIGDAKEVFKDANHASLHVSVGYVEHNNQYQIPFRNHEQMDSAVNI